MISTEQVHYTVLLTQVAGKRGPNGGLYGAGRFGYTINQFSASATTTVATASWADVNYAAELSASIAAGAYTKVSVAASALSRPDLKGVRAFYISFWINIDSKHKR